MSSQHPNMEFCLDTSFIVRLFESFPRDMHANLWKKIEEAMSGRCHIICEVEGELKSKFDEEYAWCVAQNIPVEEIDENNFLDARKIIHKYPSWIKSNTTDLYFADPFIVSHAQKNGCTVVTAEKVEPPAKKKKEPKIPDVCDAFNVGCIAQEDGEIEIAPINKFLKLLDVKN